MQLVVRWSCAATEHRPLQESHCDTVQLLCHHRCVSQFVHEDLSPAASSPMLCTTCLACIPCILQGRCAAPDQAARLCTGG